MKKLLSLIIVLVIILNVLAAPVFAVNEMMFYPIIAQNEELSKQASPTTSKVYIDGKEVAFIAYNIDGNNYFKLRDVGAAMDFGITWDGSTNTISIDTASFYFDESSKNKVVKFQDINLETAIREIIGKPSGDIILSDVYNIRELTVTEKDIVNLEGIQY